APLGPLVGVDDKGGAGGRLSHREVDGEVVARWAGDGVGGGCQPGPRPGRLEARGQRLSARLGDGGRPQSQQLIADVRRRRHGAGSARLTPATGPIGTRFGGVRPASTACTLSAAILAILVRVAVLALPMW